MCIISPPSLFGQNFGPVHFVGQIKVISLLQNIGTKQLITCVVNYNLSFKHNSRIKYCKTFLKNTFFFCSRIPLACWQKSWPDSRRVDRCLCPRACSTSPQPRCPPSRSGTRTSPQILEIILCTNCKHTFTIKIYNCETYLVYKATNDINGNQITYYSGTQ